MPETKTIDEEVAVVRPGRGVAARAVQEETIAPRGVVKSARGGNVEDDTHNSARRTERALPDSTEKLLQKMEAEEKANARKPAPHDEGDADEDEVEETVDEGGTDDEAGDDDGEAGDDAGEDDGEQDDAGADEEGAAGDGEEDAAGEDDGANELVATNARLEARNRELTAELEIAKKTPKAQRTERETALVAAEAAYIEEGTVPALRKFLAVIVGAAPDSKEVDMELSGLYTDLAARELGVTLDENQKTLRDNARTRLLLARDKREKAEAGKKPVADNSADDVNYGEAVKHIEPLLTAKSKGVASIADENPMLMALAEDIDGMKPAELLARAIRQEIMTGSLDPNLDSVTMIKKVAPKIERYYAARAAKIAAAAKNKKPDTAPSGKKPKAANATSTEQRQSPAARTLTNATVSRAPAKNPKTNPTKVKTTAEKTRKDFPSEEAWQDHLFTKHNFR